MHRCWAVMTSSWAWCRTMLENASMWTYAWTSDVSICIDDSYGYLYALRISLGFSIPSCVVSLAVGHGCVAVWSVECSLSLSILPIAVCCVQTSAEQRRHINQPHWARVGPMLVSQIWFLKSCQALAWTNCSSAVLTRFRSDGKSVSALSSDA